MNTRLNQNQNTFKEKNTLEERKQSFKKFNLLDTQGQKLVPIILEKKKQCQLVPLDKIKFSVPENYTLFQVQNQIRMKIMNKNQIEDSKFAIFLFVQSNKLQKPDMKLKDLAEEFKDEDGFLYIQYDQIETFG